MNPNIHKYGTPHLFVQAGSDPTMEFHIPDGYSFVLTSIEVLATMGQESLNRCVTLEYFELLESIYFQTLRCDLDLAADYYFYGYESNPAEPYITGLNTYFKLLNLRLTDDHHLVFTLTNPADEDEISEIKIFGYLDLNII